MNTSGHLMQQDFSSTIQSQRPVSRISEMDQQMMTSGDQFNGTLGREGPKDSNPASLKGQLQTLDDLAQKVSDELSLHKQELQILKSEKDTLQQVLTMKSNDVKKTLLNEILRLEEEMQRHFQHQKAQNNRIQTQINSIQIQKTAINRTLIDLQGRISELEIQIGDSFPRK